MKILTTALLLALGCSTTTNAQKSLDPDVERKSLLLEKKDVSPIPKRQSVFYDAVELYYIHHGYRVYPEQLDDPSGMDGVIMDTLKTGANTGFNGKMLLPYIFGSGLNKQGTIGQNPGTYRLRECITHKIVEAEVRGDLLTILQNYKVSASMQQYLENIILQRYPGIQLPLTLQKLFTPAPIIDFISYQGSGSGVTTKVLQGMTDWAIEAVNREIQEALFVRLKKVLEKIPELRIMFPETLNKLASIEVTNYNNSLNAFRRSFKEDFGNLSANFVQLSNVPRYQGILRQYPLTCIIFAGADVHAKTKSRTLSAAEIISRIGESGYLEMTADGNVKAVLKLAITISDALRDVRTADGLDIQHKGGWVDKNKLRLLEDNDAIHDLFIAMLQVKLGSSTLAEVVIANQLVAPDRSSFRNILVRTGEFETAMRSIRLIDSTMSFKDRLTEYVTLTEKLFDLSLAVADLMPVNSTTLRIRNAIEVFKANALPYVKTSANIAVHIEARDYAGALYAVDTLLSQFQNAFATGSPDDKDIEKVKSNLLHYGLFLANVAEATTASDVKDAINGIALPKGSSRIKKESSFSWGINAYAGFAHVRNKQYDDLNLRKEENTLFVPFGLAVSRGRIKNASLTLFAGIVDVGAIFTYRVENTDDVKSEIRLQQVLSPSLSLIYGFPIIRGYNIPLSIGAGMQWGPRLRKVDNDAGNSVLPFLTRRFQVFAAIDLPVLNFHVSRGKRVRMRN